MLLGVLFEEELVFAGEDSGVYNADASQQNIMAEGVGVLSSVELHMTEPKMKMSDLIGRGGADVWDLDDKIEIFHDPEMREQRRKLNSGPVTCGVEFVKLREIPIIGVMGVVRRVAFLCVCMDWRRTGHSLLMVRID